jgi:hypothetical protein
VAVGLLRVTAQFFSSAYPTSSKSKVALREFCGLAALPHYCTVLHYLTGSIQSGRV